MPFSKLLNNSPRVQHGVRILIIGFASSLFMGAATIIYGIEERRTSHDKFNNILINESQKSDLLTRMRSAARERSLCLFNMVSLEDPFERDTWFLEFNKQGARFARARMELLKMIRTPQEKIFIEKQGKRSSETVPVQNKIVDLVQANQIEDAKKLLITKGLPMQNAVFIEIGNYQLYIRNNINEQLRLLNEEYNDTQIIVMLLGLISFLIVIWIAIYVIRSTANSAREAYLEKEQALVTLSSIGDAVITTDSTGIIQLMNTEAEKLTGWLQQDAVNRPLITVLSLIDSKTGQTLSNPISEAIESGRSITSSGKSALINRYDNKLDIEYNASAINDQENQTYGGVIVFRDVTTNRELERQLSHQASHDALTGLINRREFEVRLNQAITNSKAEDIQYALLYLDLDQFKVINDMGGHNAGDELLKQLSKTVKNILRESDSLARLGGDEFGILMEGCPLNKATDIAETIRNEISNLKFYWHGQVYTVGASIGIIMINADSGRMNEVMSAVDTACYTAKDLGRNKIQVYQPGNQELNKRKNEMHWKQRITAAINDDSFVLYAQEIFPVKETGTSARLLEVLIRLQDADGQLVTPQIFLPAAERYLLTSDIDKWVIEKTLLTIAELQLNEQDLKFSINLSGSSLNSNAMLGIITDQFEKKNISPDTICFEITESMAISNITSARKFISILKGLGCSFALDDFGKGLSSFTYLKHIPVDMIKIDGSFIRDIINDPVSISFVESIIKIAHVMGLQTVAEYVESEEIDQIIRKSGIDYVQGYYASQPVPLASIIE